MNGGDMAGPIDLAAEYGSRAVGAAYRFGRGDGVQSEKTAPESTQAAPVGVRGGVGHGERN